MIINASEALHEPNVIVLCDSADRDSSNATSWDGFVSEILTLLTDRSGESGRAVLQKDSAAIALLDRWIDEYGDTCATDLDEQLAELQRHRLTIREP